MRRAGSSLATRSRIFALLVLLLTPLAGAAPPAAADSPSRFATLDGLKVHYESYGKGREAVVFVHGWTCDLTFWKAQLPAFAAKTRTLAVDLPGHGKSDAPETAYTMELFARAVEAAMRDAGVDRAVLVGHSMGTPVVRQFYRRYPEKTRALVLVDGSLRPFADKAAMEPFFAALRGPNYKQVAGQMIDGMMAPMKDAAERERAKAAMLATPQHVAVSAMEGMAADEIWTKDPVEVPVLAVLAKSPFWPADTEEYFRSIAPDLEFHMWEGVSHFLMMDEPARFNDALSAFLAKRRLAEAR